MFKAFLSAIGLLALAGCSATGPTYSQYQSQEANSSVVYIYRPSKSVNCCVAPAVYINGQKKNSLKNGGYVVYELEPGTHVVAVGDGTYGFEKSALQLDLGAGESYYLKWVIGPVENFSELVLASVAGVTGSAIGARDYNLVPIKSQIAKEEIRALKLSMP